MRRVVICCLVLALSTPGRGEETPQRLDPAQPSTANRLNPVTHDFDLVVTVTAPAKTKLLRVWLPIPPTEDGQEVLSSEITTFPDGLTPRRGTEPLFGNQFAYLEFRNPQGAQQIRHRFRITVWELRWNLDAERIETVDHWPESFDRYRRGETQAVETDGEFETLLTQIVPRRGNPLKDFAAVLQWTDQNLKYDHTRASLRASSRHALRERTGHCSDYHGFCAAMGRLLGQPTRVTYGLNMFPKASPSHCKLEAFLPPYGWVSFDVSETQKLAALIDGQASLTPAERQSLKLAARRRLTTGFRDNTWCLQTRGTDYELVPRASARVPVVRTIYAEADGQALPDPDPSNPAESTFAWMTSQRIVSEPKVTYPFTDLGSLDDWSDPHTPAD